MSEPLGAALSAIKGELADVIATANHREATPGDAAVAVLVVVERALREVGAVVPVRCGDCRLGAPEFVGGRAGLIVCGLTGGEHNESWHCADGERRD